MYGKSFMWIISVVVFNNKPLIKCTLLTCYWICNIKFRISQYCCRREIFIRDNMVLFDFYLLIFTRNANITFNNMITAIVRIQKSHSLPQKTAKQQKHKEWKIKPKFYFKRINYCPANVHSYWVFYIILSVP